MTHIIHPISQVATVPEAVARYTNPIAIGYTNFRIL